MKQAGKSRRKSQGVLHKKGQRWFRTKMRFDGCELEVLLPVDSQEIAVSALGESLVYLEIDGHPAG